MPRKIDQNTEERIEYLGTIADDKRQNETDDETDDETDEGWALT